MTLPSTLRIERPYASLDAYLEGDAWTVERTDMVLLGVSGLAPGTSVKFEIVLANGAPAVVGEGRIVEPVLPDGARPGGMRVRFRQLDAPSKALLRRALEAQKRNAATRANADADADANKVEATPGAPVASAPEPTTTTGPTVASAMAAPIAPAAAPVAPPELTSGVRHRAVVPVSAPGNREALLERLRERGGTRRGAAE